MLFELNDILGLRSGWFADRQVAEFRDETAVLLQLRSPIVYLSVESLVHINTKHSDISDYDLLLLPIMVRDGLVLRENAKPNILGVCYQVDQKKRLYASLKIATKTGFDIWVSSVRRMRKRQTKAMMERCEEIQRHK